MNRCNCGSITIVTSKPCTLACADCFIPANYIVPASDRVAPCGGSDTITLSDIQTNIGVCTGNVTYSLYSFSTDGFNSVSITSNGALTYELSSDAEVGTYYEIIYRIRCDVGGYGGYGVVQVTPDDLCLNSNCSPSETCDKCTGDCVDIDVDLSLNIQ